MPHDTYQNIKNVVKRYVVRRVEELKYNVFYKLPGTLLISEIV